MANTYSGRPLLGGSREQNWPWLTYLQALWLQWAMLAVVIALSLCFSIVSAAPSSTTTICFIAVAGILLVGGHLNAVALHQSQPLQTLFYTIYFLIPHLEWFDIRDRVVYDWGLVDWLDCVLATLYAVAYTGLFLLLTWLGFRRKSLNT